MPNNIERILYGLELLIEMYQESNKELQYTLDHPNKYHHENTYDWCREHLKSNTEEIERIKKLINRIEKGEYIN